VRARGQKRGGNPGGQDRREKREKPKMPTDTDLPLRADQFVFVHNTARSQNKRRGKEREEGWEKKREGLLGKGDEVGVTGKIKSFPCGWATGPRHGRDRGKRKKGYDGGANRNESQTDYQKSHVTIRTRNELR